MRRIILYTAFVSCFVISAVKAQQSNALISFSKSIYDFGTIKEEDGPVVYSFEFVNSGKSPLIIQKISTSCDCTTSEWTKEPLNPGAKGVVKVTFNPIGRIGAFDKTVTVYSNAKTTTVVLQVRGVVKERAKTLEDIYNRRLGDFRFKTNHLSFDRVFIDKLKTDSLEFICVAQEPVKIGCELNSLPHLVVKFVPETVKPNEKGLMIVKFDPKKRNDWGFVIDRFYLTENGKNINGGIISISASIEENFSTLSETQRTKAPRIEFERTEYDFGTIDEGTPVDYEFTFKNVGKSDLLIRKIKSSCGCTTVAPADLVIKPGKSSSFKASINTKGFSGRNAKSITVITNDPITPTVVIRMSGIVNTPSK